jgi:hypothetical protein
VSEKVWSEKMEDGEIYEIRLESNTLILTNEKGDHYGVRWKIETSKGGREITVRCYTKNFITGVWEPNVAAILLPLNLNNEEEPETEEAFYTAEDIQYFVNQMGVVETFLWILHQLKSVFGDLFFHYRATLVIR